MTLLKYTQIQLFVDSSFFTKLLDKKLNDYKLDTSTKPIVAFITAPHALTKFNQTPVLNLDYSSFDNESLDNLDNDTWHVTGTLHLVNTIEEFKKLDKLAMLKKWGGEIEEYIDREGQEGQEQEVNHFHLVVFADLKKYRFLYWLAYPQLYLPWHIETVSEISEIPEINTNSSFYSFDDRYIFPDLCLSPDGSPLVSLKNHLFALARKGSKNATIVVARYKGKSREFKLQLDKDFDSLAPAKVTGWERTVDGKLAPKMADLGGLIDPKQLASQAVDLNLKLMKWRVAPKLDLDIVALQKVLLLGAGTLGSYVSRALLGWGVRNITLVDNGRVSYSNPVRQPLFSFQDCFSGSNRQGAPKAERASEALKEIFPGVSSQGLLLEVPMIGHAVLANSEDSVVANYRQLDELIQNHDAVFLLMDSRESRWLPTVMGAAYNKIVINAALGFDSYLVMRHGPSDMVSRLGCYYCNDVVAPQDSLSDRTLDQMCTVTRPGGALMASSMAVELFVSLLQHPLRQRAPPDSRSVMGHVPHQIRGFLNTFSLTELATPAYAYCSGCSEAVLTAFKDQGWEFVKKCLNSSDYLEDMCGLRSVQEEAEKFIEEMDF